MDVYSLRLNWDAPAVGVVQNVLHYQQTTATSDSTRRAAEGLMDAFFASVFPKWAPCIPSEVLLNSISSKRVSDPGGPTFTKIYGSAGTGIDGMGDSGIALDIALMPDTPLWVPGHIYLGPTNFGMIERNEWTAAYVALVDALILELDKPITGAAPSTSTWNQVIWTRKGKTAKGISDRLIRAKPTALNKRLLPFP